MSTQSGEDHYLHIQNKEDNNPTAVSETARASPATPAAEAVVEAFMYWRQTLWPNESAFPSPTATLQVQAQAFLDEGATPEICAEVIKRVMRRNQQDGDRAPTNLKFCARSVTRAAIEHRKATERTATRPAGAPLKNDQSGLWRARCRAFRDRGLWPQDAGPKPGMPGCRVPPDILSEFGDGGGGPT